MNPKDMVTQSYNQLMVDDWQGFGVPMYWSNFDSGTNCSLIESAGFRIISAQKETEDEGGYSITFLWVVAQKPG